MKIILFKTRLRDGTDVAAYQQHVDAMYALARSMPGFVSSQDFASDNGDRLAVIQFQDDETLADWREHPEHRAAQERGRAEYYASYSLQVCDLERDSHFTREQD